MTDELDGPTARDFDMTDDTIFERDAERVALVRALKAALGYMMNARIDLETGCTKATAIATISGGIERARVALAALAA